jgi:hypothetical protein
MKLNINSVSTNVISRNPFFFASQIQLNRYDSVNVSRSFRIAPSFFIENKKKNLWEFHILFANVIKSDNYVRTSQFDSLLPVTNQSYQNGQMLNSIDLKIGANNHINLSKKSTKSRAFLTLGYQLGLSMSEFSPYTTTSYYREHKAASIEFGLSSRLGYNITEKLFTEINPPIRVSMIGTIGRQFFDNPLLPEFQRSTPIANIDPYTYFSYPRDGMPI